MKRSLRRRRSNNTNKKYLKNQEKKSQKPKTRARSGKQNRARATRERGSVAGKAQTRRVAILTTSRSTTKGKPKLQQRVGERSSSPSWTLLERFEAFGAASIASLLRTKATRSTSPCASQQGLWASVKHIYF
ncbi:hypothetical protein ES332_D07G039800v1 [Gossypium tomentosum]|uniref:Uncharacterized protein n=1 Tax=Gossypium tomentosum TaxID=34277 RepID=A0A5D2K5I1_GOSTO|nr:hypothetical protein ES332_D07G039800v1 [Gossypium tomentosum]